MDVPHIRGASDTDAGENPSLASNPASEKNSRARKSSIRRLDANKFISEVRLSTSAAEEMPRQPSVFFAAFASLNQDLDCDFSALCKK
jgi:hypothetical protein